jgi:hypothetical protein
MKRYLIRSTLALSLLLVSAFAAVAQTRAPGLSAGATFSTLTGDISNTTSRTGFMAGAFWSSRVSRHWGIRLELNYVQKGGGGVVGAPVNEAVDLKLDYLELPLLVLLGTDPTKSVVANLQAGVSVGFNVLCEADFAADPGGYIDCRDTTVGDTNVDFTIPVGIGVGFKLPGGSILSVEARYALGLTNVARWDGPILEAVPLAADDAPVPSVRTGTAEAILRWTVPLDDFGY